MSSVYSERFYCVHYYEVDYKGMILPSAIANYFQDIAIMQSEQVGVGLEFLKNNSLAWSLYQWDIDIKKYPLLGQSLKVTTRPLAFDKFNAYREFKIFHDEEVLVEACSRWVLLDINKMKPTIIPSYLYEAYGINNETKHARMSKIPIPVKCDYQKDFFVRFSDIDTNKHVNNAKYIQWALETLPLNILTDYLLANIKVVYRRESKYGDIIKSVVEIREEDNKIICIHEIKDKNENILCVLQTQWKEDYSKRIYFKI